MEALTKNPESDIINFNLGAALYKEREYDQALDHFQKALLSEDARLKEKAYYNSGNTLYQIGRAKEQAAVEQAVTSLEKSLNQYERALEIDRKDGDTLNNYAFVEKELKRLKEMMQNQQQQQKNDQKQDSGDSQDQKQQQGGEQKPQQDQGQREQQEQSQQQQNEQQQGQQEHPENKGSQQEQSASQSSGERQEQRKDANGQTQANAQELTQEEAQMLLENYQQTEEPQGLLNLHQKIQDSRPVTKDW
ncbi:MAG: hypothetical protein A3C36_06755 [Omnitrophica WOR_2 bacterium RIFCSPHIGHO2_02_FULL_52_10]|nr:MAG: hypothetical protein A3C36_06755 [Omnitrophica WOR_2 bacterium RIFCSPHIGHO2_02_FULL_52_10]